MFSKVRKAVFPVAGLGTRFLPATKANPKEMLPIVDKPLIQYAVEESTNAGITQLVFVTSSSKRSIEDHFDSNYELEANLKERKKYDLLALVQGILPQDTSCVYIRQQQQLGLGHAVLCAKQIVNGDPFAVLLADDLIDGEANSCLQQMLQIYEETGYSVLAVEEVPHEEVSKYGIVELAPENGDKYRKISSIVEKPSVHEAPSNFAVVGRYILTPRIFHYLASLGTGAIGEIQLTDGIAGLLQEEPVYICQFKGKRYDCGSKIGYLQATIELALQHPEVSVDFAEYLRKKFNCEVA